MFDTEESPQRRRATDKGISTDKVLQVVGGVLLLVGGFLLSRSFDKLDSHEGRIIRIETTSDETKKEQAEIKSWIQKLGEKIDRISEAVGARKI